MKAKISPHGCLSCVILLERHIEFRDRPQTEKELGISPQLRSVKLDVFSSDVKEQLYSFEMQKEHRRNLPKRSRFYQGQIDITLLPPGSVDFDELNTLFLVMICPFDMFGKELCRYTFVATCIEDPTVELEDGAYRIFINTKGKNREQFSREFVDLLDYINASAEEAGQVIKTEAVRKIHAGIEKLKQSEATGVKYMQEWEERIIEQ